MGLIRSASLRRPHIEFSLLLLWENSRRGKVTRVRYRWGIEEVAPWMMDRGYEAVLRKDVPAEGVPAGITLVGTNKGWMPMLR